MPTLKVLDGEAGSELSAVDQTSSNQAPPELVVVRERGSEQKFQLGLPGICRSRASLIVTSTLFFFRGHDICTRLIEFDARVVVDVRIAPEFFSLGSSVPEFVELVTSLGKTFRHIPRLANRRVGSSSNAEIVRQRYEADLDEQIEALHDLRDLIDTGPILLLGPERAARNRDILVAALQRIRPGFEVIRVES